MHLRSTSFVLLAAFTIGCGGSSVPLETLDHDGVNREYFLHVPASYTAGTEIPLLFNFHGFGGTSGSQLDWSDFRSLADAEGFLVVYPQGTDLDGASHWNSGLPSEDNKSDADDFGFVNALIDHLSETYSVDPNRIYATGYSNGGFMSYSLACYHSDRFAAIAPVASTMLNEFEGDCAPERPVPVFSANGTDDGVVPYNGGTQGYQAIPDVLNYWVTHNTITADPEVSSVTSSIERTLYAGGTDGVDVDHYRIEGGDHVWFSDDFGGDELTTLVWDFLSGYDLDGRRE